MIGPIARRWQPLAVVLLCGTLVAGCGSSGGSTTSGSSTTKPVATTGSTSSAAAAAKTPTVPSAVPTGPVSAADLAQAVAACRSVVQRATTLSASLKSKVEGICNKAASGNIAAARTAAKEVCVEVINASPIPAADKTQALAECKTS